MNTIAEQTAKLAADLVRIDSRSFVSNVPVADCVENALGGFEIERSDYVDEAGVPKRVLVAARGVGGIAFSGHMDTVPDTGWRTDPWSGRIDEAGVLHGLGSADMKGPVAAFIVAARALPPSVPVALLLTTDEETTKQGAKVIARQSALARRARPSAIVVTEPTRLVPVRGHRNNMHFTATATGSQAHSSTGEGVNANWALLPFLNEMQVLHDRLRSDPELQDPDYDPPFSDFNMVLDNHGTAINVTAARATARIKFRYSASIDPALVRDTVAAAAARAGLAMEIDADGSAPELPRGHPLIRMAESLCGKAATTVPFGTDASILQELAPCLILGPGDIDVAHKPDEHVSVAALAEAVPVFMALAERVAQSPGEFGAT